MNRVYKIEVEVTVEVPEGIEPDSAERFQVNGWDAETENYICTLETDNAHFAIAEMIRLGREGV